MIRQRIQREISWFYPWLRHLSQRLLARERTNHTLQPTALANEVLAKLMIWQGTLADESMESLCRLASVVARQTLIDSGRKHRQRMKNLENHAQLRVSLPQRDKVIECLRHALRELEELDPGLGKLIELRFIDGRKLSEVAEILGWSERTAGRRWSFAKAWLAHAMHVDDE